jgi:hypothetical protein
LFAALVEIVAMRNYFCHHPWMAAPVIIVGLVFSRALQITGDKAEAAGGGLKRPVAAAAGAFIYGFAILIGIRANNRDALSLVHLVRENLPRTQWVVVVRTLDPATAGMAKTLSEQLDRHFLVVESLKDIPHNAPATILSAQAITGLQLVNETAKTANGPTAMAADWFNRNIARRKDTDKLKLAPTYYLYRPAA